MDKAEISRERLEAVLGELVDRKLEETKRADAAEAKITELRNLVAELRVELRENREENLELREAFDRADDLAELLVDLVVTATMGRRPPEVDAAAARLEVARAIRAHSLAVPQGAL